MFVIELIYKAGLASIDAHMAAHMVLLDFRVVEFRASQRTSDIQERIERHEPSGRTGPSARRGR